VRGLFFRTTGSLDNLQVEELSMPVPKAGEVLLLVFAAAINPSDAKNVLRKILPFEHLAGMFVKAKFPLGVLSVAVVLIAFALPSLAEVPPPPPPYELLRYEEDYRYLQDPNRRNDFWDPVKYLPLNRGGDFYLSLGGEARERYEYYRNFNWGQGPQTPGGYSLQRYMFHTDFHLGEHVRIFWQLKSGLENGRRGGPRPTDEDRLDVNQLFSDVSFELGADGSLTLRTGRHEMAFGSQRLVSVRESPNVRQCFDGARAILHLGEWRVDGFATRPVETNPLVLDDHPNPAKSFWGVYAVTPLPLLPKGNIDLYYLGFYNQNASWNQKTAPETRHSVGMRLWGQPQPWDYNFEFVLQGGTFGTGHIGAWTAASDTGYTLRSVPFQPRIGLKANIASGDGNQNSPNLGTFNALFPKGAYFGEIALIGPANFFDLHPALDLHITEKVKFTVDWDIFWRQSLRDGIYGSGLNLLRSGKKSRARYIGSQPEVQVELAVDRHIFILANYAHFFPGPFIEDTGPSRSVDFVTTWITYKF
jgi:hypothetical protein